MYFVQDPPRRLREGAGKAGDSDETNDKCYVPENYDLCRKNIYLLLVKWYKHILVDIIILRLD